MKYNNRLYPHPVLGIVDDINGIFSCNLSVESDKDVIVLKPSFNLDNHDLEELVKTNNAKLCIHVYCRGTMFRESYEIKDIVSGEIKIKSSDLNGETEVDFLICSNKEVPDYKNSKANLIYGQNKFQIEKGDILAYGGKGKFFANKSPEQLKAVSSIMKIKKGNFKNGPFYNEYSDKYITVCLSETDYNFYYEFKENKKFINILHASIVIPSLLEAIYFMKENDAGSKEFEESEWIKIINTNLETIKGNTVLEKIQEMLDLPLNREFLSLENFENE
jgi:hypothetical protein